MSVTRPNAIQAAKVIAQDPANLPLLLTPNDYNLACAMALEHFRADRPNLRIVQIALAASAARYVLFGTGAILASSGLDAWIDGTSEVRRVFTDYRVGGVDNWPLDETVWRVVSDPPDGSGPITVLELLDRIPSIGSTMRLEYLVPHAIDDANKALTSIRAGDVTAFETLIAAKICEAAARRYAQNTGTSQFQAESVDRRTQSDVMKARAKELMATYADMVGAPTTSVAGSLSMQKMVIKTDHGRGRLWHRT